VLAGMANAHVQLVVMNSKDQKRKKNQIHSGRQVFNMAQEFLFKGL